MTDRYDRQSFLGARAQEAIATARVGIVGLGGGGSHLVQQLAHLGFSHYVLYDPDQVEESNLNRLVGATQTDALEHRPKLAVAERVLRALLPEVEIDAFAVRWQDHPLPLRSCDVIVGGLDSLLDRSELEVCARRFLVPYIDIGLGVRRIAPEPPRMSGQIVLSMPGYPCFRCIGFLNEEDLAAEARLYGDAGPRPQVVWANGLLASIATGLVVDLVTDWTESLRAPVYLTYDANSGVVLPHPRLRYAVNRACVHFPDDDIGEPTFTPL